MKFAITLAIVAVKKLRPSENKISYEKRILKNAEKEKNALCEKNRHKKNKTKRPKILKTKISKAFSLNLLIFYSLFLIPYHPSGSE